MLLGGKTTIVCFDELKLWTEFKLNPGLATISFVT